MSLLDLLAERFDFARYRTITLATAQSLRSKAAMAYKQPGEMVALHSPASVQFWRSDSVRLDSGSCDRQSRKREDYVLETPATCLNCRRAILQKTLVEPK